MSGEITLKYFLRRPVFGVIGGDYSSMMVENKDGAKREIGRIFARWLKSDNASCLLNVYISNN